MSYAPLYASNLNQASGSQDNSLLSSDISSQKNGASVDLTEPGTNGTASRPTARSANGSTLSGATSRKVNGHLRRRRDANEHPIIVHSHLCWNWVWQRPQQFLSRLSQRRQILFVEMHRPDPQLVTPTARVQRVESFPNVQLLQMQFPDWRWQDGDWVDGQRRALLEEALAGPLQGQFEEAVQWFYDPMAVAAFGRHEGVCTVYDCMDELSKFQGAPPAILEREASLLQIADVVFTGGRKLFESKSRFHDNCHFYGCGVDVEHFGKARLEATPIPDDIKALAKPVIGFFGVVDERMDYALVAKLAEANPGWSVVIIGPATKVNHETLPKRANLHWLGGRDYAQLPAYCKAFDVCIMPFELNAATEYINPTKALEYMATGRNIVSTAVPDVVRNFGTVVKIANSHEDFITLCRKLVRKPDPEAIANGLEMARGNTWESIVQKLENHIAEAISAGSTASLA